MATTKFDHSYIAFHPLAYTVKLYIELVMTDLIVKVVRSSRSPNSNTYSGQTQTSRHHQADPDMESHMGVSNQDTHKEYSAHISAKSDTPRMGISLRTSIDAAMAILPGAGIQKTVSIVMNRVDGSKTSSMEELQELPASGGKMATGQYGCEVR
jgi:hypothetical protein